MKIRKEEFFVCEGCSNLYEVDITASPRDHLGNLFCDSCTERNDALFKKYWDEKEAEHPELLTHTPDRHWM